MSIKYYPSEKVVRTAMHNDEPMIAVISYDASTVVISPYNDVFTHYKLLVRTGYGKNLDDFFRIVFDRDGADWHFICPPDYKNIRDISKCFKQFYKDGFCVISDFLQSIGYLVGIDIAKDYHEYIRLIVSGEGFYPRSVR